MGDLSTTMADALNNQIQREIESAYIYLSMSLHCESVNLKGSAHWLKLQWEEELGHASKMMGFINDRGGRVALQAISKPPAEFGSLTSIFESVLKHEQSVTASIHKLCELAAQQNDYATQTFLQWFVTEQVEEEAQASEILENLKLAGDQGPSLFMVDRHLGSRQRG
jgi:ferritin